MKILIFPILLAILGYLIYKIFVRNNKKTKKRSVNKIGIVVICILAGFIGFLSYKFYLSINAPDTQCLMTHTTTTMPPAQLKSASDYFAQGNYDYDIGNCRQAVIDYSTALQLDPYNAQTYNNRGYAFMRMHDYGRAIPDLNQAIAIRPDYVNALINRGDIYNFYYQIDHKKAIADYNRVIALGATQGNSVCAHKAMAQNNNIIPLAFLRIVSMVNCR